MRKKMFTGLLLAAISPLFGQPAKVVAARAALHEFSHDVQGLIKEVSPAVVAILVEGYGQLEGDPGQTALVGHQTKEGTGVFVSPDGYLITNAHVVKNGHRIQVRVDDPAAASRGEAGPQAPLTADVVGIDLETDLAVLKVPGKNWRYLPFADSSKLTKGEIVFAIGSPRGLENSASMGIISAAERQLGADASQAFIQTDAPINPGNSGGPLVTTRGEIAGINTFIVTSSGGSEGLGFAIPSALVKDAYAQIKRNGKVRRGELGVIARSVTPTLAKALSLPRESGVLIQDVIEGKAAAEAGMRINDIVVRVDGRPVQNMRQFASNLFRSEIGEKLKLDVIRDKEKVEVMVALKESVHADEELLEAAKAKAVAVPRLGVLAIALDQTTAPMINQPRHDYGVIVVARLQTSRVFQEELEPGDVIYSVNGRAATNIDILTQFVRDLTPGSPLVVQVQRQGILRYLVLGGE